MKQAPRLLVVAAALLLAGCSTASEPQTAMAEALVMTTPVVTTVATTMATTAPVTSAQAIDPVEIVERTMATPHRYEVFWELPDGNQDIDPNRPIQTGSFDGTWLAVDSFLGPTQPDAGSDPMMQAITSIDIAYFALPGWRQLDSDARDRMLAGNPLAPAVDSWVVVDIAEVQKRVGIEDLTFTPNMVDVASDLAETMASAVDVQEGPPSAVRGVATRTFAAIIPADPEDIFQPADIMISFQVDAEGFLRSVAADSVIGRNRIEIFAIGEAVTIELPASAIDITDSFESGQQDVVPRSVPATMPTPTETPTHADEPAPAEGATVLELIAFQPELAVFYSLLIETGLAQSIDDAADPPRSVFAPTNDGLERIADELDQLRADDVLLNEFVARHFVEGSETLFEFEADGGATSIVGVTLPVTLQGGRLVVGLDSSVLVGDVLGNNGQLHIIDRPIS